MILSVTVIAQNLNIDKSTVYRVLQLFFNTGTVRKLTDPVQLLVLYLAMERPGIKLQEIQEELLNLLLYSQHSHFKRMQILTSEWVHKTKAAIYKEMNF